MFIVEYLGYFIEYILKNPFTQVSWFWGMIVIIVAMFQRDDYTVKKLMLLSALFWGTHFYLLGVYSGLAATIIWVVRIILSCKYKRSNKAFIAIILLTIVMAYFTVDSVVSFLPIVTSVFGAYSYFYLEKIKLRFAMMANSVVYLAYDFFIGSVSGIANELMVQVILSMTIYRMLHPEWWSHIYTNKIKWFLWKKSRIDYDRFVFIHDRLSHYRKQTWNNFHQILHCDLRTSILQKKWTLCKQFLHSQKGQSALESTLSRLHLKK